MNPLRPATYVSRSSQCSAHLLALLTKGSRTSQALQFVGILADRDAEEEEAHDAELGDVSRGTELGDVSASKSENIAFPADAAAMSDLTPRGSEASGTGQAGAGLLPGSADHPPAMTSDEPTTPGAKTKDATEPPASQPPTSKHDLADLPDFPSDNDAVAPTVSVVGAEPEPETAPSTEQIGAGTRAASIHSVAPNDHAAAIRSDAVAGDESRPPAAARDSHTSPPRRRNPNAGEGAQKRPGAMGAVPPDPLYSARPRLTPSATTRTDRDPLSALCGLHWRLGLVREPRSGACLVRGGHRPREDIARSTALPWLRWLAVALMH